MGWTEFFKAVFRREHKLAPMTWITAIGAVIYTVSPIDIAPELFLGPLGLADDAGLWGVVVALIAREKGRWEAQLSDRRPGRPTPDDDDIIDVDPL